ncbi:xanthine dehydrogenase family protein subunit M [Silvimonas sp. JCM 19000]
MNPFAYVAPQDTAAALNAIQAEPDTDSRMPPRFLAGGTNLVDLMKADVMHPARLVDVNGLPLDRIEETADAGLHLGALARNADTAYHPLVRTRYPLLTAAILAGASPQIRNMASNGGNLLQRTRCHYFYDIGVPCNKRDPGSGCAAIGGITRQHAILGASAHCIATHPSDLCVALAALAATVHVQSTRGTRQIAFAEFHRLPEDRPQDDTTLAADELITHITLPATATAFAAHSAYLKLRDRASYAFALVSVAAALQLDAAGRISQARVALGGVAHKPWRVPEAEALLQGVLPDEAAFRAVAARLLRGAQGQGANDFKIELAQRAIVRALQTALAGTRNNTDDDYRQNGPEALQ